MKPSPDASASSSSIIRTPPVPARPFSSTDTLISPDFNVYEAIRSKSPSKELEDDHVEMPLTASASLTSLDQVQKGDGEPSGRHLENFVCGCVGSGRQKNVTLLLLQTQRFFLKFSLANDQSSEFCKHVSAFIKCTVMHLGQDPSKTLQNVCYNTSFKSQTNK